MPTITLDNFDDGLWLLGGRDQIPAGALRNATGTNPVNAGSLRQRFGNVQLSSISAISLFYFYGTLYSLDAAGNFYKNFSVIQTGLTPGNRASFVKAPPHFGSSAYMFVAGCGKQFKVDATGAVTNWGIAAPPNGMTAVANSNPIDITINSFNNAAGLTALGSAVLSTDTSDFVTGTGSVQMVVSPKTIGGLQGNDNVDLNPPNSGDNDFIQLWLEMDDPTLVKSVVVNFDLGTNFTTDFYHVHVPTSNLIAAPAPMTPNDVAGLDVASGVVTSQELKNPPPVSSNTLGQEFTTAYKTYLTQKLGSDPSPSHFGPSQTAVAITQVGPTVTTAANSWWLLQIPRGNFTRVGNNPAKSWHNVTKYRIHVYNHSTGKNLTVHFDNLQFLGGVGTLGTYQYLYTFANSKTGSYSQPNTNNPNATPTPATVINVNRTGITLGNFPVPTDPQVDQLIIWRTMGNGGIFYKLATLTLAGGVFPTTYIDDNADMIGYGPNPFAVPATIPPWTTGTAFTAGSIILPTTGNAGGFVFVATNGGTSGGAAPTWPQVVGATVSDNGIVWQNIDTSLTLGLEPLLQVNVLPSATATQCIYFQGTMFLCGDTATGSRGRMYYSSPGYQEGVAGYTDITNDDDPTTGFAIFNNNLYIFTQKALWLVVDISINALLPGFAVVQQMGAPGCIAPYSIKSTPNALIWQGPDGLYAFDGYYAELVAPQILPLFRGEVVEGNTTIGTIVAATYGRDEYWFSNGDNKTWAMNIMPSSRAGKKDHGISVRMHSPTGSQSLFFENSNDTVYAGYGTDTAELEVFGQYGQDYGAVTIPLAWRFRSLYSGSKYTYKVQRGFFDINPAGQTLNAFMGVDGTDYLLGTITGNARAKFDFTFNKSGSVIGLYLTNNASINGNAFIELFKAGIETDPSGTDDADGSSGNVS